MYKKLSAQSEAGRNKTKEWNVLHVRSLPIQVSPPKDFNFINGLLQLHIISLAPFLNECANPRKLKRTKNCAPTEGDPR